VLDAVVLDELDDVVTASLKMYPFICPPGKLYPLEPIVVLFGVQVLDERPW
jgi:hypothetical protein